MSVTPGAWEAITCELVQLRAELARVTEERDRYRELLQWVVKRAEFYYHHGRKSLDNLPGWIHGDDGPVYGFLKIAQRIETALTTPEPPAAPSSIGIEMIAEERKRQIEVEGWSQCHDDEHSHSEMAWAAVCYAAPEPVRTQRLIVPNCGCRSAGECTHDIFDKTRWLDPWPWSPEWDKRGKHDRIRQLTIAGALIAAEIDRLKRAAAHNQAPPSSDEESTPPSGKQPPAKAGGF